MKLQCRLLWFNRYLEFAIDTFPCSIFKTNETYFQLLVKLRKHCYQGVFLLFGVSYKLHALSVNKFCVLNSMDFKRISRNRFIFNRHNQCLLSTYNSPCVWRLECILESETKLPFSFLRTLKRLFTLIIVFYSFLRRVDAISVSFSVFFSESHYLLVSRVQLRRPSLFDWRQRQVSNDTAIHWMFSVILATCWRGRLCV